MENDTGTLPPVNTDNITDETTERCLSQYERDEQKLRLVEQLQYTDDGCPNPGPPLSEVHGGPGGRPARLRNPASARQQGRASAAPGPTEVRLIGD